jgi:hypothetical protein
MPFQVKAFSQNVVSNLRKTKNRMNKILLLILILFLNQSCKDNKTELPNSLKIITKFRVLDEEISPNNMNCSENSIPFIEMKENDCSFSVGIYEFDIEKKYLIDENGNLKEFWKYLSEGPLTYSLTQLNSDKKYKKHENLEKFNVRVSKSGTEIIDTNDTLKIEQVFKSEKLILMKNSKNIGRRILYEYE